MDGIKGRLPRKFRRRIVLERYFHDGADVIADYDLFGRHCRALYVAPFLDENLLVERELGCEKRRYWYTQDGLGSVRQLIDHNGNVQNSYTYTAWGVPLNWRQRISNRYTFTGREWNAESALYHYRARHYAPYLGRFSSPDPIQKRIIKYNGNLYLYIRNMVTKGSDPLGLNGPIGPMGNLREEAKKAREQAEREKATYLKRVKEFLNQFKGRCFSHVTSLGDPAIAKWAMQYVDRIIVREDPSESEGRYFSWSNTIYINAKSLEEMGETELSTLWHELMHAIFDFKSAWGSISDIDEERYTMFMEQACVTLRWLEQAEDLAFSKAEGVREDKPCPARNRKAIGDRWGRFLRDMRGARRGEYGVLAYWPKSPGPLSDENLRNLKKWTGMDVDPNKILKVYRGEIRVPGKRCCCCCGTTPLKEIIRDAPPVAW